MIGYLATILFAIEGAQYGNNAMERFLFGLLESSGGGFLLRDIILMNRIPVLLSSPLEILTCLYIAIHYKSFEFILRKRLLPIFDAISAVAFVVAGSNQVGYDSYMRFLFGVCSGCGGGLIRGILLHQLCSVREALSPYRILTITVSLINQILPTEEKQIAFVLIVIAYALYNELRIPKRIIIVPVMRLAIPAVTTTIQTQTPVFVWMLSIKEIDRQYVLRMKWINRVR